eukprot:2134677-Pyramimonas_sp.AAC.1
MDKDRASGGKDIHIQCASGFCGREPESPYCSGYGQKYCPNPNPKHEEETSSPGARDRGPAGTGGPRGSS